MFASLEVKRLGDVIEPAINHRIVRIVQPFRHLEQDRNGPLVKFGNHAGDFGRLHRFISRMPHVHARRPPVYIC